LISIGNEGALPPAGRMSLPSSTRDVLSQRTLLNRFAERSFEYQSEYVPSTSMTREQPGSAYLRGRCRRAGDSRRLHRGPRPSTAAALAILSDVSN
jgi:hypothetical protein